MSICTEITFSPRNYPLSNHFLLSDYAIFPICVAFEVMTHSRSMDRQIMQICKSLFSALFLDPVSSALSSRRVVFSLYLAIVAPGILPKA